MSTDIEVPAEFLDRMSLVMDDRECERMVAERDRAVAKRAWHDAVSAARAICREEEAEAAERNINARNAWARSRTDEAAKTAAWIEERIERECLYTTPEGDR